MNHQKLIQSLLFLFKNFDILSEWSSLKSNLKSIFDSNIPLRVVGYLFTFKEITHGENHMFHMLLSMVYW